MLPPGNSGGIFMEFFMYPYIHLHIFSFEKDITTYGVVALFGFLFFLIPGFVYTKKQGKDLYSRFVFMVFMLVIGSICASILYTLTNIGYWIKAIPLLLDDLSNWKMYMNFGIVYYGGFIGMIIAMMAYSKLFNEDVRDWVWQTAVSIPGFHAIGRIGCVFSGCCYGKIVEQGGIYNAVIDKYCIPIQLYEAIGEFIIFFIILIRNEIKKDSTNYYKPLGIYCTLYSVLRFVDEFWRGDKIRGVWGPFSTSQYISLLIFPIGIYCLLCPTEKNFFNKWFSGRKSKAIKTETK